MALNVNAGTTRFLQLSGEFRTAYDHRELFSGWTQSGP
jgi:hypothetical protein